MPQPSFSNNTLIRFGAFEVDLRNRKLRKRGHRIRLQDQPFAVLATLLEHPGELVPRETLQQNLWSADTFVDFDHGLNNAIKRLREALRDSADTPRFIETVPRSGYRFIAPVTIEDLSPASSGCQPAVTLSEVSAETAPNKAPALIGHWRPLVLLTAIAGLILIAAGWLWPARRNTVSSVARISPVTTYPGDESQPSLSPDGRQVAFSWGGEKGDNRDIYIAFLGEQHPVRLTTDPADDNYPAWAPDGKHIAFIRHRVGTQADIILIPAIGGPERILRRIRLAAWLSGRMLAWSPDGKWLCFTNEVGTSGHHVLFLLSPESGAVRQLLAEQDNGLGDSSPAFSPDGRWLAFGRFIGPAVSRLLLQPLSPDLTREGSPLVVADAGINPRAPVWMLDGKELFFLEGSRIMRSEAGGPAKSFYVSRSAFDELTLAAPGPRLVASVQNGSNDIWTIPLDAKGLTAAGNAQPTVQSTAGESHPRFSPDGRMLAFQSDRSGKSEIWLADSNGENPRQLTHLSAYIAGFPHWSPDGQFLVFHARVPEVHEEPQLYVVRVQDGVTTQVTHGKPGLTTPSWSMDGQTIYANAFEGGETHIYSLPAAGGARRLLWEGADAVESPGRKLLIYDKEDKAGVYTRSLAGDPAQNPERLLVNDFFAPWGGFIPVEDGIYYVGYTAAGIPRAFRFHSFATGVSVDVAPAPANLDIGLTVTPDRSRLAYSTKAEGGQDLVEIELR